MNQIEATFWKKCSSCKKPIAFGQKYYLCSVSTCTSERTGYVFCTVGCFEVHLPGARHKDAAAIENYAPKTGASGSSPAQANLQRDPTRKIISTPSTGAPMTSGSSQTQVKKEILIVASRLKDYIQAKGDMNTSSSVMDFLSDYVRVIADRAIDNARAEGRKTVMDRDLHFLKNSL